MPKSNLEIGLYVLEVLAFMVATLCATDSKMVTMCCCLYAATYLRVAGEVVKWK